MDHDTDLPSKYQMSSPWFSVSMGLLGLIIGYGLATGMSGTAPAAPRPPGIPSIPTPPSPPSPGQIPPSLPPPSGNPATADDDAVLGKADAPVTVIEFSDFQCPFCKRFRDQTFDLLKTTYIDTGKVKFVYRDFPLSSIHPNAQKAAEAAECAGEQEKYFDMHDKIFAGLPVWGSAPNPADTFKQYAQELGLKKADFDSCLDSGKMASEVSKDLTDGSASGISGTPGFWIVGKDGKGTQLSGAQPFPSFQAAVEAQLAK